MSAITKKYKILFIIFTILSFLATLGPLIYYITAGFIEAELTSQKVSLTCFVLCAGLLVIINTIMKYNIRSTIWLILIGIYFCIDNIMPLLFMIAVGTILDEFVLTPLKKRFKSKYSINKEIDKRTSN